MRKGENREPGAAGVLGGNAAAMAPDSGLTLVEVMVAVTVLSFILGVVYTTFVTISQADRRVASSYDVTMRARNLIDYMSRDLASAFLPVTGEGSGGGKGNSFYRFTGGIGDDGLPGVDFTALFSPADDFRDSVVMEIGYYLTPREDDGYRLMKREDDTPDGEAKTGGRVFELMDGLKSLTFEFLTGKGEWVESWNSSDGSGLPRAVKMKVSFLTGGGGGKTFSTVFPLYQGMVF